MAGRFTHGSFGKSEQPPKVAGDTSVFRCNPLDSQKSRRPSLSESGTLMLANSATTVKQVWFVPGKIRVLNEDAFAGRLNGIVGSSQRPPSAPTNGDVAIVMPFTESGEEKPDCPFATMKVTFALGLDAA